MDSYSRSRSPARTDVGVVLRKSTELLGQRPIPTIGAAILAQLPTTIATTAGLLAMKPLADRLGNPANFSDGAAVDELVQREILPNLPAIIGGGLLALVVVYLLYAIQVGAVMQVVVDAYARRPSTLGAALASGVRRAPSLMTFLLTKQFVTIAAAGVGYGAFLLPIAALPSGASYAGPVTVVLILVGALVSAAAGFGTWSMLSLGAGAIVAEKLGPFAALARGVDLARADAPTVALTWLATGSVYMVLVCVTNCCSSMFTTPLQMEAGMIAGAVANQLVQLVPLAVLGAASHAIGAVLYGELAGLGLERDPAEVADVFR